MSLQVSNIYVGPMLYTMHVISNETSDKQPARYELDLFVSKLRV